MGQKVNPLLFRLNRNNKIKSSWFESLRYYSHLLKEDYIIRKYFYNLNKNISQIKIKRNKIQNFITINIYTPIPEKLLKHKKNIKIIYLNLDLLLLQKQKIKINLIKIYNIFFNTTLILNFIIKQIKNRISVYRIWQNIFLKLNNAKNIGLKIQISGCLNGLGKARTKWYQTGKIPLQTINANIDYIQKNLPTKFGIIGIKIWLLKN